MEETELLAEAAPTPPGALGCADARQQPPDWGPALPVAGHGSPAYYAKNERSEVVS